MQSNMQDMQETRLTFGGFHCSDCSVLGLLFRNRHGGENTGLSSAACIFQLLLEGGVKVCEIVFKNCPVCPCDIST